MPCRSWLLIRTLPGRRADCMALYQQLRVLERCREVIPGFLGGELLASATDPDVVCATVRWADPSAYQAWLAHPQRQLGGLELMALIESAEPSALFDCVQTEPGNSP